MPHTLVAPDCTVDWADALSAAVLQQARPVPQPRLAGELTFGEESTMLTEEHHAVNTMIGQGAPFDHIEDYINTLALPSEQLSALWLLAWAEAADPAARRQVIAETLATDG